MDRNRPPFLPLYRRIAPHPRDYPDDPIVSRSREIYLRDGGGGGCWMPDQSGGGWRSM